MQEKETNQINCLHCGIEILPPKRKFCCRGHKNQYNHKHLYNYKYNARYRSKSPRNYIAHLRSYKGRKKELSLDYLVSLYEKQKGLCSLSGVEMTFIQGEGKTETNISIDRIDSDLGYIEGNIQLVCHRVNVMKQEYSQGNLIDWCLRLIKNNTVAVKRKRTIIL